MSLGVHVGLCMSASDLDLEKSVTIQLCFFVNTHMHATLKAMSFNDISFMQIVSIIYGALYFWLSSLALSSHHHVYNGKRFVSFYPCIVILEQDPCIHSLNKNSSRCHAASAVLAMLHYGIFSFSGSCHSWLQKFFRLELWELGTLKILA